MKILAHTESLGTDRFAAEGFRYCFAPFENVEHFGFVLQNQVRISPISQTGRGCFCSTGVILRRALFCPHGPICFGRRKQHYLTARASTITMVSQPLFLMTTAGDQGVELAASSTAWHR